MSKETTYFAVCEWSETSTAEKPEYKDPARAMFLSQREAWRYLETQRDSGELTVCRIAGTVKDR